MKASKLVSWAFEDDRGAGTSRWKKAEKKRATDVLRAVEKREAAAIIKEELKDNV